MKWQGGGGFKTWLSPQRGRDVAPAGGAGLGLAGRGGGPGGRHTAGPHRQLPAAPGGAAGRAGGRRRGPGPSGGRRHRPAPMATSRGRAAAAGGGGTMSSLAEPPASRAPSRSPARTPALSPASGPSRCGGERRRNASDAGVDLGAVQVSSPAGREALPGSGLAGPGLVLAWPCLAWLCLAWPGRCLGLRTSPSLCSTHSLDLPVRG